MVPIINAGGRGQVFPRRFRFGSNERHALHLSHAPDHPDLIRADRVHFAMMRDLENLRASAQEAASLIERRIERRNHAQAGCAFQGIMNADHYHKSIATDRLCRRSAPRRQASEITHLAAKSQNNPSRRVGDQRGAGIASGAAPSRGSAAFTFRTAASRNVASHRATVRHALARGFLRLSQSAGFLSCNSSRLLPNELEA